MTFLEESPNATMKVVATESSDIFGIFFEHYNFLACFMRLTYQYQHKIMPEILTNNNILTTICEFFCS